MAAPASGANALVGIKRETTWGVAATGNYLLIPGRSVDPAPNQNLVRQRLIGQGRNPPRPQRGGKRPTVRVAVPMEARGIGHWLTACLGLPTTTGSGTFTHVWKSTATAIQSYSMETQHPDITPAAYQHLLGATGGNFSVGFSDQGEATMTVDMNAKALTGDNITQAGTPTLLDASDMFGQINSFIKKDGVDIGNATNFELTFGNNLDIVGYIGGGGNVGDIIPGDFSLGGRLTTRMKDLSFFNLAEAGTIFDLEVGFLLTASKKITFEYEAAELMPTGIPIRGPDGIQETYELAGSRDAIEGQAFKVTLVNDVASYS